jgi:hypothetical protein
MLIQIVTTSTLLHPQIYIFLPVHAVIWASTFQKQLNAFQNCTSFILIMSEKIEIYSDLQIMNNQLFLTNLNQKAR